MLLLWTSLTAILLTTGFIGYHLLSKRHKDLPFFALLIGLGAAAALEFCSIRAILAPEKRFFWQEASLVVEASLPLIWLLFALTFSRESRLSPFSRFLLASALTFPLIVCLAPSEFFLHHLKSGSTMLFLTRIGFFFCLIQVVYLTFALMHLERTLVLLPRHARWRVKFEIIGAGTLVTMYLVYFSQGLLYQAFDANLLPPRSIALLVAVILMAFSCSRRGEKVRIQVSREFAFRSLVVLAIGCYLLGLGLLGEGLRAFDPAIQRTLMMVAALTGGVVVVALFLSETTRRRMKVFLHKNFYQDKYDYREQWLRFNQHLGAARGQEALYQAILAIFAESFAVGEAILYLRDPDGDTFRPISGYGSDLPADTLTSGNPLLCCLGGGWIFASRDENPQVWDENRPFLEQHSVSFIVPLRFDHILDGFILLGRPVNQREDYTYEDFDLMKLLAAQATSAIRSLRLTEQLAAARELAAIGKVSAFVLHDLKNLVSSLALIVENARSSLDEEEFRADMLATLESNVRGMRNLISRLQDLKEKPTLDVQPGDLASIVRAGARQVGERGIEIHGGPVPARFDAEEMQKVALNLLLNAKEAGGQPVRVEVGERERAYFLVRDHGCGMTEEFIRSRLFRPFETTKKQGIGIGLYQCKHIVEAHGGTIEVSSIPGQGSEFTVWLPILPETGTAVGTREIAKEYRSS